MKIKKGASFLFLVLLAGLISFSATKKSTKIDYLVFGKYCGLCRGNCTILYKVNKKALYKDTSGNFLRYDGVVEFPAKGVKGKKYNIASRLMKILPATLLDEKLPYTAYGCPDCSDQCGYYVEFEKDGKKHMFRLDTNTREFPEDLTAFVKELEKTLIQLK